MIKLSNAGKKIKQKQVLKGIDLTLSEGKMYLVEGHNGCGKTMLLRMICGLIKPTEGSVEYEKSYSFGAIIENPSFAGGETGMQNLSFLANINKKIGRDEILQNLKAVNLQNEKDIKVKNYSLGMRQRLAICQAVMEDQDVILLDEPFNALDEENYFQVIDLLNDLKKRDKIIVIAAHNIEKRAKLDIDEVIKMNQGALCRGES